MMSGSMPADRVLFVFADPGRIRYFEPTLEVLATRGVQVVVAVERFHARIDGQWGFIERLVDQRPNVTLVRAPKREKDGWTQLLRELRLAIDHLHFLGPEFEGADHFRERSAAASPKALRALLDVTGMDAGRDAPTLEKMLRALERGVPRSQKLDGFVAKAQADVVAITPLVWFGAPQADWVRSAAAQGIPSLGCMFSWDNLTSKGAMVARPDGLAVWNEAQRHEAVELHGMEPERVVATGAQNWDHWFGWAPTRSRAEFCAEVGLPADKPYVLWLESSGYLGAEGPIVRSWLKAIRSAERPEVRDAAVLVRPHPQVLDDQWSGDALRGFKDVAVWPPRGQVPLDESTRRDFFDTLHHAAAVVGVNTSAFIEAAILDRPSFTFTLPELSRGQVETVHFRHLLVEHGGHVMSSPTIEGHVRQVEETFGSPAGQHAASERARAFVQRFVRPHGVHVPAAPRLADLIQDPPAPRPRAAADATWDEIAHGLLEPFAARAEALG